LDFCARDKEWSRSRFCKKIEMSLPNSPSNKSPINELKSPKYGVHVVTQSPSSVASAATSLADAMEDAQQRIEALLKHPDDLNNKLDSLIATIKSDKASIDVLLKADAQSQLDDTQDGLKLLWNSKNMLSSIQENLALINETCCREDCEIENYPVIKEISRINQNYVNTMSIVSQFQDLNSDIQHISDLLEQDCKDPLGPAANLLQIHFNLYRLEEFRDSTLYRAKLQGPSVVPIVQNYFKKLDSISEKFSDYFNVLAENLLGLIEENRGNVIVRLCKIVEAEEKADELVLTNVISKDDASKRGRLSTFVIPRKIKNYRSRLFSIIHEKITLTFLRNISGKEQSVSESLEACKFVFRDLSVVFEELVPRFPPKYKIFDFYVLQYHKQIFDLLNRLSQKNLETRDILSLISWKKDYYSIMQEKFCVSEEILEPKLLDDKEPILIEEYVGLIETKLREWANRLIVDETFEFKSRENPPQIEDKSTFVTDTIVIFFQMINQQMEVALESSRGGNLLLRVAEVCFEIIFFFQDEQKTMVSSESKRFLVGEVVPAGLPEYIMAIGNNHLKGVEYAETLQKSLEKNLDDSLRVIANQKANSVVDGFVTVSKLCNKNLVAIVFKDIESALSQLFTNTWYENRNIMASILKTLEDYLLDFQLHLSEYLFGKFITECIEQFVVVLLKALRAKTSRFKMVSFPELAKGDLESAISFWSEYKPNKRVLQSFDVISKILGLIESSDSLLFLSWYSIWKSYSDMSIVFAEELLYKRDDLDRTEIREFIATCKEKTGDKFQDAKAGLLSVAFPNEL
jgi:exocyst complex component 3